LFCSTLNVKLVVSRYLGLNKRSFGKAGLGNSSSSLVLVCVKKSKNSFIPSWLNERTHIGLLICYSPQYILLLGLILLFNFRYKFYLILISFFFIFIYSSIVFIIKFQIEKLSILALQRYIAILLLANFLLYISIIIENFKKGYNNYVIFFFIIFLISVTPKKTIGLFVTDKIYYSNLSNQNFKINRGKISELKNIKNIDSIFLIHKDRMSDYTNNNIAGEHTFYHDIILYELYPKKIIFVEYYKFNKNINYYKSFIPNNSLFIFFDLSKAQLKNTNYLRNFFILNTY
jgi:hypothetical protein